MKMNSRDALKTLAAILILVFVAIIYYYHVPREFGRFSGYAVAKLLPDGRNMEIQEEFTYFDQSNTPWTVPKGAIVNGASIPEIFWSEIGSPFVGKYRDASIVHDYFCDIKKRPWKDVHRIFYYGSLARGEDLIKAKTMYFAVYLGGPRWETTVQSCLPSCHARQTQYVQTEWNPSYTVEDAQKIMMWIREDNPKLEEIERRAEQVIAQPSD